MPTLAINKKAAYDYELTEHFSAGLVLTGPETKAIKLGQASLKGAFVVLKQIGKAWPEAYLLNCLVTPYKFSIREEQNPTRSRKLLLNRAELLRIGSKTVEKGLTLVPLKLYTAKGRVKLDFAIGRGKKKQDKRADIKKKDIERELKRRLKG